MLKQFFFLSLILFLSSGLLFLLGKKLIAVILVSLGGIVLSLIFFFSFLRVLRHRKNTSIWLSKKNIFALISSSTLSLLLGTAIYAFFYFDVITYRKDFNQNQLYTLSPFSKKIIQKIKAPLTIQLFAFNQDAREIERFLQIYSRNNPLISFQRINLAKSFIEMNRNNITQSGTILINQGEKKIKILPQQIIKKNINSQQDTNQGKIIYYERIINSALVTLNSESREIYGLTSQGEKLTDELKYFQDSLKLLNYHLTLKSSLKGLNLKPKNILIIYNFQVINQLQYNIITDFITQGGKIILMLEPQKQKKNYKYFQQFLDFIQISINLQEIAIDLENHYFNYYDALGTLKKGSPLYPRYHYFKLASQVGAKKSYHPIVSSLAQQNWQVILKTITPLQVQPPSKQTSFPIKYSPLLKSQLSSWGEKNLIEEIKTKKLAYTPNVDSDPPLIFSLGGESLNPHNDFKIIILGDIDIIKNESFYDGVNETFIINSLYWLSGKTNLISQGFKPSHNRFLPLSGKEKAIFLILFLGIIPIILIILFIGIRIKRSKKTV